LGVGGARRSAADHWHAGTPRRAGRRVGSGSYAVATTRRRWRTAAGAALARSWQCVVVSQPPSSRFARTAASDGAATRGMTGRYLVALGLVALLSTAAYLSLRQAIATQETSAAIVNYSGKRRYTSQRAALFATRLADPVLAERLHARDEMLASIAVMESAHLGLLEGDPRTHLPGRPSPAIAALYFGGERPLDRLVRDYIARIRALAGRAPAGVPGDDPELRWVLQVAPNDLLVRLDEVVAAYQREIEADFADLRHLETAVFAATLGVLALEALFIFRPMVRRVQQERRRLVRAEAYNRSLLDNCHDGIVTIDRHGDVVSANPAVAAIFGIPRDEVTGRPFSQLIHSAPPGSAGEELRFEPGIRTVVAHRRDGSEVVLDVTFSAMTVDGDRLAIAIMRVSTERLRRYAAELERRNHELDQFAYIASHDLKAPLRAIAHLATWIEGDSGPELGGAAREHLQLLHGRVRRLESLVAGMHRYATSGRPGGECEAIDTGLLICQVAEEHDPDCRFTLTIADAMPTVEADRTRLWQVFSNLVANAIKHHHRGQGTLVVGGRDAGDCWEFSVADDGPGIAPEHHERIFVIFQTLASKDVKESLGLGLALVKRIVDEAGGRVTVDSALGRGATFRFTWPKPRPVGAVT
jgi:PAS domain S-box-containing protein